MIDETRSLGAVLRAHALSHPEDPALIEPDWTVSWAEYDRLADAIAARLIAAGLAPGEVVGLWLPDGIVLHAAMIACERAGLMALGIGARAGLREVSHLLEKAGAVALITLEAHGGLAGAQLWETLQRDHGTSGRHIMLSGPRDQLAGAETAMAPIEREGLGPDAIFLLNSTSGTTGLPKCVAHTQRRWYAFHDEAAKAGELGNGDRFLSAPPCPFGFGMWTAHVTPLLLRAPVVVFPRFDPAIALAMIARHRVTVMAAVSTQFILMQQSAAFESIDLASLRLLFAGGEAIPESRARAFEAQSGALVLNLYGSNETGALSGTTTRDPQHKRLTTAGRRLESMEMCLLDGEGNDVTASGRGRPAARGPLLSQGYYNDPEANARLITADGWMLMDDLVEIDAEGYVAVVGRIGDFIIRGGKNISCAAVEEAAITHPAIALAAAVAAPDSVFGERVALFVALHSEEAGLTLEELRRHLAAMGASKELWPEYLFVRNALPRASGDKIAKRPLRDELAGLLGDLAQGQTR